MVFCGGQRPGSSEEMWPEQNLEPTGVVEVPNVTLPASQLRNSLRDGRAVWRIIPILLQYLALSHVVHC